MLLVLLPIAQHILNFIVDVKLWHLLQHVVRALTVQILIWIVENDTIMDILSYFNIVLPFLLLLESLVKDVYMYVSEIG